MAHPRKIARGADKRANAETNEAEQAIVEASQQLPSAQKIVERLNNLQFCPITKIVDLAKNARSAHVQLEAAKCLLNKYVPDVRAVEVEQHNDANKYQLNVHFHNDSDLINADKHNNFLKQLKPFSLPVNSKD